MPTTYADAAGLLSALQGRWKPVYQEVDGQMVPASISAATVLELEGNAFKVLKDGKVAYEGFFTINFNPEPSPWRVALIYKNSIQPVFLGGPRPGVGQVEGDTFKWCIGAIGQPPPYGLNTYPRSESVLSIYQRDPPSAARTDTTLAVRSINLGALPW